MGNARAVYHRYESYYGRSKPRPKGVNNLEKSFLQRYSKYLLLRIACYDMWGSYNLNISQAKALTKRQLLDWLRAHSDEILPIVIEGEFKDRESRDRFLEWIYYNPHPFSRVPD